MLKRLIIIYISTITLISCQNKSSQKKAKINITGEYVPFGFQRTQKTIEDSINLKQSPSLYFYKNYTVKIIPDFSFGYFKDSLFKYEFNNDTLFLQGKSSVIKIKYKEKYNYKTLQLFFSHKYIESIEFLLTETSTNKK